MKALIIIFIVIACLMAVACISFVVAELVIERKKAGASAAAPKSTPKR